MFVLSKDSQNYTYRQFQSFSQNSTHFFVSFKFIYLVSFKFIYLLMLCISIINKYAYEHIAKCKTNILYIMTDLRRGRNRWSYGAI